MFWILAKAIRSICEAPSVWELFVLLCLFTTCQKPVQSSLQNWGPIVFFCCTVVQLYCFTVVLLCFFTYMLLYCCTVVLLYCCTVVLLYCCTVLVLQDWALQPSYLVPGCPGVIVYTLNNRHWQMDTIMGNSFKYESSTNCYPNNTSYISN